MTSRPWSTFELLVLRAKADRGAGAIAVEIHRSIQAVRCMAQREGVSLRTANENRGRIRGFRVKVPDQKADQKDGKTQHPNLRRLLAAALRAGTIALEQIEDGTWPRCPWCGSNPIALSGRAADEGVCQECFNRRKVEAYVDAQRETAEKAAAVHTVYNREKQRAKRDRDAISQADAARAAAEADMAEEGWA
jgi:hypothetical protein